MVALLYITENGIKCFPICRIDILFGNFIGFIFFEIYQITAIWYILTLTSDFCGFSFCFFAPVLKGAVRYLCTHTSPSVSGTRSRHSPIDGHGLLLAVANILSCITLGGSWSLDRHPGWYVSNFVRRPMSVSVAVGSPVHSSDETTLLPLASDNITSSNLP